LSSFLLRYRPLAYLSASRAARAVIETTRLRVPSFTIGGLARNGYHEARAAAMISRRFLHSALSACRNLAGGAFLNRLPVSR
jgi:hypothetical protein